jgi:Na+-transporting methylmalonyl-CoA/oxaloacetate decarboxylase beta subunit
LIFLVILIFTVLAVSDFSSLVHEKKWREVTVLSILYLFVLTFACLQASGVVLPSPAKAMESFIVHGLKLAYPKP